MSNSSRFDPEPNTPYGTGEDGEIFYGEEEANEYMRRTRHESRSEDNIFGRSKRVTVKNPSRKDRIRAFVTFKIEEAISDAMEALIDAINNGDATESEIRKAIHHVADPEDIFDEWLEEEDDLEDEQ